ncbi:MAG: GFA family protein [Pseudomonadales bacterium]
MIKGKCLCGEIKYTLTSELLDLYNCHCSQCRAFSGSSFATNASIIGNDFKISDPNHNLAKYETNKGERYFCKSCGSPIYSCAKDGEEFPTLHCGSITGYPKKGLDANIWVSEKCAWTEIDEDIQSFDGFPE